MYEETEKAREKGLKEGREQGIENSERAIINNMFQNNMTIDEISYMTNISIDKIRNYLNE